MEKVTFKRGRDRRALDGHPWVFAGEVFNIPQGPDGQIVEVYDSANRWMGLGYCNPHSNILVRLLTRRREEAIDENFFRRRLSECLELRKKVVRDSDSYRLVHAEADGLPGLIVDRYGDYLVVQVLALGIEKHLGTITRALAELTGVKGIYERSDVPVRKLEGLPERTGVLFGEAPPEEVVISEGPYKIAVDLYGGQKTGFFLDQRRNRLLLGSLAAGKTVLNCFSYSGGFSVAAGMGGAESVLSIDISAEAIKWGERNAQLNGLEKKHTSMVANAFDALPAFEREGRKFDLVILDPPAFTKSKDSLPGAIRGYKEINLRAMRLLNPGGLLVTSSCS
ncbi:MAG TPA: class I SAM-dependent rRNA methyltransferase, partial [Chroococcales cyanobacterium]